MSEAMKDATREMARDLLAESDIKIDVIAVLAEFFEDSFKDNPTGVSDWLIQNETSVDLFVELVAQLREES